MTEEDIGKLLGSVRASGYMRFDAGNSICEASVCLDGDFTAKELEAVLTLLKNGYVGGG